MNLHMKPFDHDELLKLDGDVPFVRSVPYGIQYIRDMEANAAGSEKLQERAEK